MADQKTKKRWPISSYSPQFWLMCLSTFLFFTSFNMIIPELPEYLTKLGGAEYKGLIISLFTLTAGLSRPFSGKLADKVGRIPVMIFGALVCVVCGILYPVLSSVAGFLFLRLFHGFSTGFKPTGTSAFVADIVPFNKRGEGMGLLGLFNSLGLASGPAIGSAVANTFSLETMFYCSSSAALLSVVILAGMKETLQEKEPFRFSLLKISKNEILEPRVFPPSLVMMLTTFSLGVILTIIPDYSQYLGMENKGWFFTFYTLTSVGLRVLSGKASDRYGRRTLLKISSFTLAGSMLLTGMINSPTGLLIAACIFGIGVGLNAPSLFAWTIDLSHEKHRGKAMATLFIALEIGIGAGALISGTIYNNDPGMFKVIFWSGSFLAFMAFLYLIISGRKK